MLHAIIINNFINMHVKSYRVTKLMQIYDLENNYAKHRQKIIKTQRKDMMLQVKLTCQDQMKRINSFHKNWESSHDYK